MRLLWKIPNGRLVITNQDNNALSLTAFASEGTGTILASTDAAKMPLLRVFRSY